MPAGSVTAFAPGRVNLLGEHTDYNGGLALPFATQAGVTVRATPLPGPLVMAAARDLGEQDVFDLRDPRPATGWRAFVRGTVAELRAGGTAVRPARLEITGTLPPGAGVASSAALCAALALALTTISGAEPGDRRALAHLCSRVENEWAGARTGLLDQYASLLGSAGAVLRIDFGAGTVSALPLEPGDWTLVLAPTGESRANAASGYNERRRECSDAARELGVVHLSSAGRGAAERLRAPLRERALHVLGENDRVRAAEVALRAGDLAALGPLLDASHASLRDLFGVSMPDVERAVQRMKDAGAAGARIHGGGFGGHVLALFPPGVPPPPGARTVRPSAGARLL